MPWLVSNFSGVLDFLGAFLDSVFDRRGRGIEQRTESQQLFGLFRRHMGEGKAYRLVRAWERGIRLTASGSCGSAKR